MWMGAWRVRHCIKNYARPRVVHVIPSSHLPAATAGAACRDIHSGSPPHTHSAVPYYATLFHLLIQPLQLPALPLLPRNRIYHVFPFAQFICNRLPPVGVYVYVCICVCSLWNYKPRIRTGEGTEERKANRTRTRTTPLAAAHCFCSRDIIIHVAGF